MMVVLVVEDDTSTRKLERIILERAGYLVVEAESGAEALKFLQGNQADVVVVDIIMPEMTGMELLAKLKDDPMTADIPVILCSSLSEHELIRKALSFGIAGYVLKPLTANKLNKKIREVCGQVPPILTDPRRTRNKLGIDVGEYKKLLHMMIEDAKRKLIDLGRQVEAGEFGDFRRFVHDLTSASKNLGAKALEKAVLDANAALPKVKPELREKYFFKLRSEIERLREKVSTLS